MTDEELIQLLAAAARIACRAITRPRHAALQASLDQASAVLAEFGWDRKAAAHAGFFTALANAAGDPRAAPVLNHGAVFAYDLMIGAGWAADGIVTNSHKRLLDHVRTGDADEAALEMEKHLRVLRFMHRLACADGPPKPAKLSKTALDPELGRGLWDISAELTKVRPRSPRRAASDGLPRIQSAPPSPSLRKKLTAPAELASNDLYTGARGRRVGCGRRLRWRPRQVPV